MYTLFKYGMGYSDMTILPQGHFGVRTLGRRNACGDTGVRNDGIHSFNTYY